MHVRAEWLFLKNSPTLDIRYFYKQNPTATELQIEYHTDDVDKLKGKPGRMYPVTGDNMNVAENSTKSSGIGMKVVELGHFAASSKDYQRKNIFF